MSRNRYIQCLASQNVIYTGGERGISGTGGSLFSQVSDLTDLKSLSGRDIRSEL